METLEVPRKKRKCENGITPLAFLLKNREKEKKKYWGEKNPRPFQPPTKQNIGKFNGKILGGKKRPPEEKKRGLG